MSDQMRIDLNADVGESFGAYTFGLDEALIPLITSANIACGYHAGDPGVMARTVALAREHGVGLGAHPGFPDLVGFGRRSMDMTLEELRDMVLYQVGALSALAKAGGGTLQHVKLHGALYNEAVRRPEISETVGEALARLGQDLILVGMAGPGRERLEAMGRRTGIRVAFEFFADRAYAPDGSLASRRLPGAVLKDPMEVAERILRLVKDRSVATQGGGAMPMKADTICVHGDTPGAVSLVRSVREVLEGEGIAIRPMGRFL